jgi:hypothetical protein
MANIVANAGKTYILAAGSDIGTPAKLATAVNATVNVKVKDNDITSQLYQAPLASLRAGYEVSGEVEVEGDDVMAMSQILAGTRTAATIELVENEELTIPTTPFKVTCAAGADYVDDCSVYFSATGAQLEQVEESPATGEYVIDKATGEYEFAAADTGLKVLVTYTKDTAATGQKISVLNNAVAENTYYKLVLVNTFDGSTVCVINKVVFQDVGPIFNQKAGERSASRKIPFKAYAAAGAEIFSWTAATAAELA